MTPTKTTTLALLCLLASSNAANLRTNTKQRELQLTSTVLNGLIQGFGPALEDMAQTVLAESFDPVYLGDETTVDLGSLGFPLPFGICQTSASATYGLGTISGLSNFDINSLELVPGSENIELAMFGLGGATWSGTWLINATFSNVEAETTAGLKASSCFGDPIEQSLTGTTTFTDPSIEITMTVGGETSNLLLFAQSSQVTTAQLEGMDFELGSIDAGFGGAGTVIPSFDLSNTFNTFLLNELSDNLEPLMIDALNNALTDALPMGL